MGDLQATIEFLVELYKFYNVDLFIRGYYQFRLTFKPPKCSHAINVEVCEGHGERGAFTLFPAFVTNDGQTAVSRTINIYYKDEEVLLKDVFLFRVHLLIDSTKAADCIDKTALEMTVDVHFTDQVVRENAYCTLPLVTSRTLKFHFSCFNGLHHQVPLLFDYYYFSVLDLIVHANVVSLGLPNWSILKQIKTGWFNKSTTTPRSSTPLFYTTLFGNRSQLGSQFYSDPTLKYAVSSSNSNSISREHFEKASAIHRNLCAILAMAHSQLLSYFDEMMEYLDEKQRMKLGEKLHPADLVEGLCKKLETLRSCEEVFDEMCSDMSVLNNELALLWLQFQESFTLNDQIRPVLRQQHHRERMMHFSEAFFVHELPWKSLLNDTDSSFQKHTSMGQCVKSSRYLSLVPAVTVECAEVDGDASSTPIFFEDRYISKKEKSVENLHAVHVKEGTEADILEHKPLSFGILNKAFNDVSPLATNSAESTKLDHNIDPQEVWVDIAIPENDVATGLDSKVTEGDGKGEEGINSVLEGRDTESDEKTNNDPVVNSADKTNVDVSEETVMCKNDPPLETNTALSTSDCERNSLENLTENMETPQDDNLEDGTGGSVVESGTMLDTINSDNEVRDIGDVIATIDTTSGDVVSGNVIPSKGVKSDNMDSLGASAVDHKTAKTKSREGELDIQEIGLSGCLIPNANAGTVKDFEIDSSLHGKGTSDSKDVLTLDKADKTGQDKGVSSGQVVAHCAVEKGTVSTGAKMSSVQYVGSSDATTGHYCIKPVSDGANGVSKPGICVSEPQTNPLLGQPETTQALSTGSNDAGSTNENCNSPNERKTLLEMSEGAIKTEDTSKTLRGKYDINSPEKTDADLTEIFSPNARENSHSKPRNTAHVNVAKRVSNSVFYEGIVLTEPEGKSTKHELTEKVSKTRPDAVGLPSNSSFDVVSCFCAGKLQKVSSPYRPTSESEASNLMLHKAKKDVISRMNYCGTVYSDCNMDLLVQPYFINSKPDLTLEPVHLVVCAHGLDGNSGDLRLVRCFLEMALPSTKFEFLMSEVNQSNTFVPFEKLTEKLVSEILHHMEAYRIAPTRISFIGHSLGNIIIRSALNHPQMEPYVDLFHTFLSLSGPHLGMAYHTSSLVSTGMWLLQKWKKSDSLLQLSLNDSTNMKDTFIYKLSKKKGLEYFTNVLLVSSVQDHYVPFHSSRIELPKSLRSNSQEYIVYREMMENLLTPLLSQPNRTLVRYSVYHCLPSSTNTFIGRAAHIAMLDSELFIEKLVCTSAAQYFQ